MDLTKLEVIFVIPNECESQNQTSESMQNAYELSKENCLNVKWVPENECKGLEFEKTHFVVFQSFEGQCFEELKKGKSTIIGPWTLITCLAEGIAIPNLSWPIFNVAMRGCFVTSSYLLGKQKQQVRDKVMLMGGVYTDHLSDGTTHLVCESPKSEKYIISAKSHKKIMLTSFIDALWQDSLDRNVHANDPKYAEKHSCPILHNLEISTTGFTNAKERKDIEHLIIKYGGKYSGSLRIASTDILICQVGLQTDKFKAAKHAKNGRIKCVTIGWLRDSIEIGYALPDDQYPVVSKQTSTPTKEGECIDPNFSMVSAIGLNSMMQSPAKNTISETMCASFMPEPPTKRKGSPNADYIDVVDSIDLKAVKKAGLFLDGCNIYLVGFSNEHREKLCKILNFSGATRYDSINERITHIVVGDTKCHELKLIRSKNLNSCPIVNVHWLTSCLSSQKPVSEEFYLLSTSCSQDDDYNSPLRKKGLSLLRTNSFVEQRDETPKTAETFNNAEADELMQQYLKKNCAEQDTIEAYVQNVNFDSTMRQNQTKNATESEPLRAPDEPSTSKTDSENNDDVHIFKNMKFLILNFNEEVLESLTHMIVELGGKVVPKTFKGIPDYTVVPSFNAEVRQTSSQVINELWVQDCHNENMVLEVMYFHEPIVLLGTKPLKGLAITLSGFSNSERQFLKDLVDQLGGIVQEQFARLAAPSKNVLASTHLVSFQPSGKKYAAALKWKIPVVDKDWLLECAKNGDYLQESRFLVGESVDPLSQVTASTIATPATDKKAFTASTTHVSMSIGSSDTMRKEGNENQTPNTSALRRVALHFGNGTEQIQNGHLSHFPYDTPNKSATNTPIANHKGDSTLMHTPISNYSVNTKTPNRSNAEEFCSQVTPVNKVMEDLRSRNLLGTPESPLMPKSFDHIDTPETPLGRFITDNPSPNLRKAMQRYINHLPDYMPKNPRRLSTPMSELKRQLYAKISRPAEGEEDSQSTSIREPQKPNKVCKPNPPMFDDEEPAEEVATNNAGSLNTQDIIGQKLFVLENMITTSGGPNRSSRKRESIIPLQASTESNTQPCTVSWDYMDCDSQELKQPSKSIFMLSGVDVADRQEIIEQLSQLGATVSELQNYDPLSTHLICPKPQRNEKILCCMAAGKWILHPLYVSDSFAAGKLLNEEDYEYGNPKFVGKVPLPSDKELESKTNAIYYWRNEIARRGYGAFNDVKAIVVSARREPIIRVIESGGGMVVDETPPFDENIFATHCLLDMKVANAADYISLAAKGVYCVTVVYISDYLFRTVTDVREAILPYYSKYFKAK